MARVPTWIKWLAAGVLALALLVAGTVLLFPVDTLKGTAERRLTERFGRTVTIGAIEREGGMTLSPVIRVRDVRVPQASWAGTGDLAAIRALTIRVRILPLLVGRFSPEVIAAEGVRLDLVRAADGRTNWAKPDPDEEATGGDAPRLDALGVADAVVRYRDAVQDRAFTIRVRVDPAAGLIARGSGTVRGAPVTLSARGGAVRDRGGWPFAGAIEGPALTMRARGTMAAPLSTGDMQLKLSARAADLKMIDAVIEAGLFGTQPVAMTADVRHRDRQWFIENLKGTIGSSDITGRLTVDQREVRTKLDGEMRSRRLDFEDLADDAGIAAALALERREGLKLVPNTRINIAKIDTTDGRISFRVDRIVSRRRPSSLTDARGVLTLDRQLLTADPLRIGLKAGAITGRVTVDQRGGRREPKVTLALDLTGSRLSALGGEGGDVDARVDGRVRLTGTGSTIRAAVGRSDGSIGLVARDGTLPAKMAELLGFDVGASFFTDDDARAGLRCAVVRLAMRGGRGTLAPLIVDTSRSQTRGTGAITFPAETIAATLTGAPKRGTTLRLPGSIAAGGTIRAPQVTVPRAVKSFGNVLKGIGRALTGRQGREAGDADCAALSRQAIGR